MDGAASQILRTAVAGLEWTASGRSLDDFLDRQVRHEHLRSAAGFILFCFFRRKKVLDGLLADLMKRKPERNVLFVLEIAAVQIFYSTGIRGESAVNVAVAFCRERFGKYTAGFVNAVLRKLTAMNPPDEKTPEQVLPDALCRHWREIFPEKTVAELAEVFLETPESTMRFTAPGVPGEAELTRLGAEILETPFPECKFAFYRVRDPGRVLRSPEWAAGRWYMQDPATAAAVSIADFSCVKRVLDVCAAPGGKSLMMAEKLPPGGILVASDRSRSRQKKTRENFLRRNWDFPTPVAASPEELPEHCRDFDLVLADVPCSNTGVFRHRPDVLWRWTDRTAEDLADLQKSLLNGAARRVKRGGRLLYSTCSIEPAENALRCDGFQREHPEFVTLGEIALLPDSAHDGAYARLMVKKGG